MVGLLFVHFQQASISKYISYRKERLPRDQVKSIIKEIETAGKINQNTLRHWSDLMSEHNRIAERGERMLLLQNRASNMNWIKFQCLDLFMIQMQSRYLAKLLDDFSSFGERVLRLVQESPAALLWGIGGQLVVERTSWCRLCAQMMTLLHVLGMADPSSARLRLRPWPDRELLEAAAERARGVFGRFARADTAMPSVRSLLSRHRHRANARGGFAAAAAEPHMRSARKTPRRAAAAAAIAGGRGVGAHGLDPAGCAVDSAGRI
jgi:hypothetical protein